MRLDALDHPKTLDFASRLNVTRPTAIGHLELLWAFTGKMAPQGNIGKWPIGAIARACDWMDDPLVFIRALVDAGFVDESDDFKLVIHDWADHAPRWVKAKLKNLGVGFVLTTVEPTDDADDDEVETVAPTTVPTLDPVLQGKGREGKGSTRGTRIPEDFLLTPERAFVATEEGLNATRTFSKFRDYWVSVPGAKGVKLDWDATWRNWVRSEADRSGPKKPTTGGPSGLPTLNFG